jgi:hypothetical protein
MQVQTKSGIINKGNYGSLYDAGIDGLIEKKVSTGKRGRPAAAPAPVYYKTHDLFGRVADTVKLPAGKGRVIIGKASASAVYENDTDE